MYWSKETHWQFKWILQNWLIIYKQNIIQNIVDASDIVSIFFTIH